MSTWQIASGRAKADRGIVSKQFVNCSGEDSTSPEQYPLITRLFALGTYFRQLGFVGRLVDAGERQRRIILGTATDKRGTTADATAAIRVGRAECGTTATSTSLAVSCSGWQSCRREQKSALQREVWREVGV